jgi:hypothetical protein
VLLLVAVVLGAGLVAGNAAAEHRELDALLTRVGDSQAAVAYSNRRVAATVDYTRPLLFGASVPARVRAGLQQLVAEAAAGQVDGVRQVRDQVAATSVLPWHRDLRRARAELVDYLDARVAYLRSVATDQDVLYMTNPDLELQLASARDAFLDASGPSDRHRVEVAFAGGTHPG